MSVWLFLLDALKKKEILVLQDFTSHGVSFIVNTLLFIFYVTLILIPNRHAIPFIVLHGYCSNDACSGSRSYQSGSTSCSWCESYKWLVKAYCFNQDEIKILECQTNNTV
ncbi:hypothetical protein ERO13_1Z049524v2 [Gossypium hirsutum]|uniref:Uncharacterized protein n=2 Tax=Gossypium TaxID=3633 RepID=A0A5J5Q9Y2_GOSBA|nr:hypothetical protein ES319_D08G000200v1 [Gossypium barbadense]KAG4109351.1 hypothetical protein ERO13_1Z049524v2 [Gossypium hirsutum]TYH04366.1 hypothetical protein ES288_A08G000200v1 [Gossypium darwinii]